MDRKELRSVASVAGGLAWRRRFVASLMEGRDHEEFDLICLLMVIEDDHGMIEAASGYRLEEESKPLVVLLLLEPQELAWLTSFRRGSHVLHWCSRGFGHCCV